MNSRERVQRAIHFDSPDRMPVEMNPSPSGLHEHGEKLLALFQRYGHDFGDVTEWEVHHPPPDHYDAQGRYRCSRTDEWGIVWEHNFYGIWGHPKVRPLDDLSKLEDLRTPDPPATSGPEFESELRRAEAHRNQYYLQRGAGNIFEIMHSLRRFEDVLMDILDDTPEINRIADMLFDYRATQVAHALALGADGVGLGDDFGTQEALIIGRPVWRRFFMPRYERLFAPVREAGKNIHFHSCGRIDSILPDLAELGVNSIWPQLQLFEPSDLREKCAALGLAVALHPDRSHLMTSGTPVDIHREIDRLRRVFDRPEGGAWWYIEIDPGFPWLNVQALFEAIFEA